MTPALLAMSSVRVIASGLFVAAGLVPIAAAAQVAEPKAVEAVDNTDGEIVVTARKRAEDILKVPVTVSALTSEDIEKRGIVSVADIAENTPGLNVNNNASGRADRSFQQLVLRGFTPSTVLSTTTSMFIDGVAVSSPSAFSSISNPERIEVLKGPQSAYFGRNTFAGAVNVVNKLPTGEWGGSVTGMSGTRNNYRVRGDIEGPILGDALTFRVSADRFAKDGSYTNAYDGGTLGDQSTTSGSLLLVAKPVDGLVIKAFGFLSRDKDGVAANSRISAYTVKDAAGNVVVQGQSNCTLTGNSVGVPGQGVAKSNPYICGTTPELANRVSSNTLLDGYIKNFLANPTGRLLDPKDGTQGFGLIRNYQHYHLTADWSVTDALTLSYLAGYNYEEWSQLSDLDGYDTTSLANPLGGVGSRPYFDFPYLAERTQEDYSLETRASYDSGPFRGTVGLSYLDAWDKNDRGGGNGALGTRALSTIGGKNRARTMGAFFGLTYDLTSDFSVSLEGRYQLDTLYAYAPPGGTEATTSLFIPMGKYAGDAVLAKQTYKNFLPRAIVNYQISPAFMVYASAAKGVNPGSFNAGVLGFGPALQQAAVDAGLKITVDPEKVTNFEIGLKGKALDNRLRFSVASFFSQWRNQINSILLTVTQADGTTSFVSGAANSGSIDLYGLEAEATYAPSSFVSFNAAAAFNQTSIKSFVGPTISKLTGIYDFSGNEQPNTSKYSANAGVQIGSAIEGTPNASWFARADWSFKSGFWSNQANILRTQDSHTFNARTGVAIDNLSLELFMTNIFNNSAYTSIGDNWIFTPTLDRLAINSAVLVGLRERRTAGVQAKIKF